MMNGVPEGIAFIVCCKKPLGHKKDTPKDDRPHTVLAILYTLTQ